MTTKIRYRVTYRQHGRLLSRLADDRLEARLWEQSIQGDGGRDIQIKRLHTV